MPKTDLLHLLRALNNYKYYVDNYPETVSDADEEELKIALQIIKDRL